LSPIGRRRPQRVLYYYWLDANFGLMYLRLQTYFPYTMQVYVNGHDWLARQMTHWGLGFVQHDNACVDLDHPQRAQELADRFAKLPWVKQLDGWARKINPLLTGRGWLRGMPYYWVTAQAEYSTAWTYTPRTDRDRAMIVCQQLSLVDPIKPFPDHLSRVEFSLGVSPPDEWRRFVSRFQPALLRWDPKIQDYRAATAEER